MLELCPSWRFVDRMCLMICGFGSCLFTMLDSCGFVEFVQLQSWITRLRGIKYVSRDRDIQADHIRDPFLCIRKRDEWSINEECICIKLIPNCPASWKMQPKYTCKIAASPNSWLADRGYRSIIIYEMYMVGTFRAFLRACFRFALSRLV